MKQVNDEMPRFDTVVANPDPEESAFSDSASVDQGDKQTLRIAEKALEEAREEIAAEDEAAEGGESGRMSVSGKESSVVDPLVGAASEADSDDGKVDDSIVVTDAEKEAFIDSVIRGTRFESRISLFGGRMTGVLRSRTNGESAAIDSYARKLVRDGGVSTNMEFGNVVRLCLLVACVKELDGVEYPEMLKDGVSGKPVMNYSTGVPDEPEWVSRLRMWEGRPDALVSALMNEVMVFESKYWKMTTKARDENFWKTGGSTEG